MTNLCHRRMHMQASVVHHCRRQLSSSQTTTSKHHNILGLVRSNLHRGKQAPDTRVELQNPCVLGPPRRSHIVGIYSRVLRTRGSELLLFGTLWHSSRSWVRIGHIEKLSTLRRILFTFSEQATNSWRLQDVTDPLLAASLHWTPKGVM